MGFLAPDVNGVFATLLVGLPAGFGTVAPCDCLIDDVLPFADLKAPPGVFSMLSRSASAVKGACNAKL